MTIKDQIEPFVSKETILHLLQNGINTESIFKERYPNTSIYLYSCFVRATLINNVLVHSGDTIFTVGQDECHGVSLDLTKKQLLLDWTINHTDFNLSYSENIQWKRFHKLFWNSTFNPLSVLLDTTVTSMLTNDRVMEMVKDIMYEVNSLGTKVAKAF